MPPPMSAPSLPAAAPPAPHAARRRYAGLMLGSIGVVFGDIGTSPLYGFQGAVTTAAHGAVGSLEIFGITSLIVWALLIVVTIKYVLFIMRADNHGEGGILSLMALAQNALGGRTRIVLALGVIGAALFYGDAIITPAISVLSAVEGLETVPGLEHAITPSIEIASALGLLIALFMAQSRGTAKVATWFGPICLAWFVAIAGLGLLRLPAEPAILEALSPTFGLIFLIHHGVIGLLVLGAVSLTITGAEALYADMGHFGASPIKSAWLFLVLPALLLNYLGQGAYALHFLASSAARGADLSAQNWFFLMAPETLRIPMVLLGVAATIIASQAVISGAYSMSNSAMQMGLLPRLVVHRTSETEAGQIYMPTVNLLLMLGVILLVGIFKNSAALQDAYGLAVTGTMSVTTALTAVVVRKLWKWSLLRTALVVLPLLTVDLAFYSANMLKLLTGGWVPLTLGAAVGLVIFTWMRGSAIVSAKSRRDRIPMTDFLASLARRPRHRVPGAAIYLSSHTELTPGALLHNLKHNGVLHETNAIVAVRTTDEPRVSPDARATVTILNESFLTIALAFGFMETPNVPAAIAQLHIPGVKFDPNDTSYFLGRRSILPTHDKGLLRLQDLLFAALNRNSADPSEVFGIPPGRVVEMGVQVAV
jgi:KUP system potassium uptake protein